MVRFFVEGGFGMYPVLVLSLVLFYASGRYAADGEPVRLRFITAASLALLATSALSTITNVATALRHLQDAKRWPDDVVVRVLFAGLKESSRPAILGLSFLSLSLILVTVGAYRVGQRELRAARG